MTVLKGLFNVSSSSTTNSVYFLKNLFYVSFSNWYIFNQSNYFIIKEEDWNRVIIYIFILLLDKKNLFTLVTIDAEWSNNQERFFNEISMNVGVAARDSYYESKYPDIWWAVHLETLVGIFDRLKSLVATFSTQRRQNTTLSILYLQGRLCIMVDANLWVKKVG